MSSRQLRKVQGEPKLPPPDSDDEDFQPLYAAKKSAFSLDNFCTSDSNSETIDNQSSSEESDASQKTIKVQETNKKKRNKKKKAQNKKGKKQAADDRNENNEIDEVERSVREVNEILGELPMIKPTSSDHSDVHVAGAMPINWRYLNSRYELKKKFGYDLDEEESGGSRKKQRQPDMLRFRKKLSIVRIEEFLGSFSKGGLTMSVYQRKGPLTYFAFDHDAEYKKRHQELLRVMLYRHQVDVAPYLLRQYGAMNMHVEFWLEDANALFTAEENAMAESFLKRCIAYMQYVLHPSFVLDDPNVRLSYNILENQPFFEAILKYLHILTNTLCHKTALELAKLLLNLDPTDPLALLLIIDILALRAMEHKWLIEAIDRWIEERDAAYMPNLKYSYALAKYQVAKKNGEDLTEASSLLRSALILFPSLLLPLLRCTNHSIEPRLLQHAYFTTFADSTAMLNHKKLADFYARFAYTKWKEDCVINWVQTTALELLTDYDRDTDVQKQATDASAMRLAIHQKLPAQIQRHLYVIQPMRKLLYNHALESVTPVTQPPMVPNLVNRYNYTLTRPTEQSSMMSHFYEFARSLLPHLNQQDLPEDVAALLRGERPPPRRNANNLQEIEQARPEPNVENEPLNRPANENDALQGRANGRRLQIELANRPANENDALQGRANGRRLQIELANRPADENDALQGRANGRRLQIELANGEHPRAAERAAIVEELAELRRAQTIMSTINAAMTALLGNQQPQQQEEAGNDSDDNDDD